MRAGGANRDGLAASKPEARKRTHHARPGQVSFDERSNKLATPAVESSGRLGKEGGDLIGGTDGWSFARKGVCNERLLQVIPVTSQAAISRRGQRHKLALRDRQAGRGRREEGGVMMPMT